MMAVNKKSTRLIRRILMFIAIMAPLGALIASSRSGSAKTQDRPRQVPTASPTPTPAIVNTGPSPINRPTAAPAPSPTPRNRIAPVLGDAPPPPRLKPKPTPTPDPVGAEIDEGSTIRVNADLVRLNVRVIDRNNRPIDNVQKGDFHVFEDGVAQEIFSLDRREVPISYGLAVDTSGSLRSQLPAVIDAAKTIINSNKAGDETFLERFISSDKIETIQDFTDKKDLLLDGLDNLYTEGGQTAVVDGVYLAAEHVAEYKKGDDSDRRRRALIVITDGEDRNSYYKEVQLLQKLREEDVQIYLIGFVAELDKDAGFIRKSPRDKAINLIKGLASESGGRAFFPQSLSELPEIANAIVRDLRTQYVVAYSPTNKSHDGSYRAIRVNMEDGPERDKRIALTRSGRIALPEGQTAPRPAGSRPVATPRPTPARPFK
jgi:Ca-activated chloride channel family protein